MRACAAVVALLWLAACAQESRPRWVLLAEGHVPARTLPPAAAAGDGPRIVRDDEGTWLTLDLAREDWIYKEGLGAWGAAVPAFGLGKSDGRAPQRLTAGERRFVWLPPAELDRPGGPPPGSFLHTSGGLFLRLEADETPPERATLGLRTERGATTDGRFRVFGARYSYDGLSVWPGETWRRELAGSDSARVLHFATVSEPAWSGAASAPLVFAVRIDGVERLRHEVEDPSRPHFAWQALELGPGAHVLEFAVEGALAYTGFASPVVGPREHAPASERRPDVLVFLADTFRADNLELDVADGALTPRLRALAANGRVFTSARSPSTYTFPSHASMFTGLYPRRAGAISTAHALPDPLPTVAEAFRAAGYRTGAVTDSAMVSRKFGLDQGFEVFDEELVDLDSTLARARAYLAASDGRPSLLFVQTYRVHAPFHASPAARAAAGAGSLDHDTLERRRLEAHERDPGGADERAAARELERLYRAGVRDFDTALAPLLDELAAADFFAHGLFVLTSDHGEAFLEHDEMYHTGTVHEEQLRVPLVFVGRGVAPGREHAPVSLVDLAPTLTALAGVVGPQAWRGRSLVAPRTSGSPTLAFQVWGPLADSTLAIIDGPHKLIASEDPHATDPILRAYRLDLDPDETHDLRTEPWASALLNRTRARLEQEATPLHELEKAHLDEASARQLDALGYGGREE